MLRQTIFFRRRASIPSLPHTLRREPAAEPALGQSVSIKAAPFVNVLRAAREGLGRARPSTVLFCQFKNESFKTFTQQTCVDVPGLGPRQKPHQSLQATAAIHQERDLVLLGRINPTAVPTYCRTHLLSCSLSRQVYLWSSYLTDD